MPDYYLGTDLGGTKTHMLIADRSGQVIGFSEAGPGNHQSIGFEGMLATLQTGFSGVLRSAGLQASDIGGAGFGVAGYDWPSEKPRMQQLLDSLGIPAPYILVNDTIPALVAGAKDGWGVVLVSGTGCNARGWDRDHRREGRVTGYGITTGEAAGATELVFRAMQYVAYEWTRRGPPTALTPAFIEYAGAKDVEDLLEGYTEYRYRIEAAAAPLVFQVAVKGDPIAQEVVEWAGRELGEMANSIIRQLNFEDLEFDVVLAGGMFDGGPLLVEPLRATIHSLAPRARLNRLRIPPVIGSVLLGMEQGGLKTGPEMPELLAASLRQRLAQTSAPA